MCSVLLGIPAVLAMLIGLATAIVPTWVCMGGRIEFEAIDSHSEIMGHPLYMYWAVGGALFAFGLLTICLASQLDNLCVRIVIPLLATVVLAAILVPTYINNADIKSHAKVAIDEVMKKAAAGDVWATKLMDGMQVCFRFKTASVLSRMLVNSVFRKKMFGESSEIEMGRMIRIASFDVGFSLPVRVAFGYGKCCSYHITT